MRLVTFATPEGARLGALDQDEVIDLLAAATAGGGQGSFGERGQALQSTRALLAAGERGLEWAQQALERARAAGEPAWRHALSTTTLLAPVPDPRKIFALAGNYAEHIREGGKAAPEKAQTVPQVFVKPVTVLVGHMSPIRMPGPICRRVDYEGELVAVIGRPCKDVPAAGALAYVAGYANFNDVSGRALEIDIPDRARTARESFFDWLNGKWFDTFGPCGPYLLTADEVPEPHGLRLQTRVNGEVRQQASTGDMIFSVAETVAWISRFVTLEPGDLIATGTPSGVGSTTGRFLQPGDVVEVEIERLGTLQNRVMSSER